MPSSSSAISSGSKYSRGFFADRIRDTDRVCCMEPPESNRPSIGFNRWVYQYLLSGVIIFKSVMAGRCPAKIPPEFGAFLLELARSIAPDSGRCQTESPHRSVDRHPPHGGPEIFRRRSRYLPLSIAHATRVRIPSGNLVPTGRGVPAIFLENAMNNISVMSRAELV